MKHRFPFSLFTISAITILSLLNSIPANAQTWQWGKRGGGMFDNGSPSPKETVVDMATDKNGNVYILGIVIDNGSADIDGHTLTTYGDRDIVISKFSCNGTYKWSKVIGGGGTDFPTAIGTDTLGHVYVSGKTIDDLAPYNVHFSTDTAQQPGNEKSIFLVQYDTLGNFQWLRQPNPDTATHLSTYTCESYEMKVLPNGDVYWFVKLHEGLVAGSAGWATTGRHPYIIQYNSAGVLANHVQLQMETDVAAFHNMNFERTPDGKFVISGGQDYYNGVSNFTMGGQLITHSLFVGMFSATGQLIWKKENNINVRNSRIISRPLSDAASNIYLAGTLSNLDTFNTYKHLNTLTPTLPYSCDIFICKLDSAGKMIWMKASSGESANYGAYMAFKSSSEIWLASDYTSLHWDATHIFDSRPNGGTQLAVSRFNTLGTLLSMDSLKGPVKMNNYVSSCAADAQGNVYIGGEIQASISSGNGNVSLASRGGESDFCFAKLGHACNCTTPTSLFATTISGTTVTLTYTGSTSGIDSVVWNYGDGNSIKKTSAYATPFSYTYATKGSYTLCAKVYSSCGTDQSCKVVTLFSLGTDNIINHQNIKIYPNPAGDYLIIHGTTGCKATIMNLMGQTVIKNITIDNAHSISLKEIPSATYILIITDKNNIKTSYRFVKE